MTPPTRRTVLRMSLWTAAGAALTAGCGAKDAPAPAAEGAVADGNEALNRLVEGNKRFAENRDSLLHEGSVRRQEVAAGQHPFATVLSCVDSRVPPELVFDRGLGDLVVVRSAGGVVDQSVLGSIEFGVAELKTPLVLVLGHRKCGAVKAAVEATGKAEGSIGYLLSAIRPAVDQARRKPGDLLDNAIRANVALVRARLHRSPVLSHHKDLVVAGGYYDLETGLVELLN